VEQYCDPKSVLFKLWAFGDNVGTQKWESYLRKIIKIHRARKIQTKLKFSHMVKNRADAQALLYMKSNHKKIRNCHFQ
jgi:hypothetical protein